MPTVDTFLTDLRRYIQHEDTKPLLGPSFYQGLIAGELSSSFSSLRTLLSSSLSFSLAPA